MVRPLVVGREGKATVNLPAPNVPQKRCDGCAGLPAATIEMHVCGRCAYGAVQFERLNRRLADARALLTLLSENGLTPYREKIRPWLAGSD